MQMSLGTTDLTIRQLRRETPHWAFGIRLVSARDKTVEFYSLLEGEIEEISLPVTLVAEPSENGNTAKRKKHQVPGPPLEKNYLKSALGFTLDFSCISQYCSSTPKLVRARFFCHLQSEEVRYGL